MFFIIPYDKSKKLIEVRGCHGYGFFADFLFVLNFLHKCKIEEKTPYVLWDFHAAYFDPAGYNGSLNPWEYYFENVSELSSILIHNLPIDRGSAYYYDCFSALNHYDLYLKNLEKLTSEERRAFVNIDLSKIASYVKTPKSNYPYKEHFYSRDFREYIKKEFIDPYIKIKKNITAKIDLFYNHNKMSEKRTIGIHLRGSFLFNEVPEVPLDIICAEANKHAGYNTQFFIATDQKPLLEKAKLLLRGPVIFYESERFETTTSPMAESIKKLNPILGENVLIECLLLSKCDFLIHTRSNVSTAALYFSPSLKHSVLI